MTGKEALKILLDIIPEDSYINKVEELNIDRYELYEIIEKELKVLDVLKNNLIEASDSILKLNLEDLTADEFYTLKEWYENGNLRN